MRDEKVNIEKFLMPKPKNYNGLKNNEWEINEQIIEKIRNY